MNDVDLIYGELDGLVFITPSELANLETASRVLRSATTWGEFIGQLKRHLPGLYDDTFNWRDDEDVPAPDTPFDAETFMALYEDNETSWPDAPQRGKPSALPNDLEERFGVRRTSTGGVHFTTFRTDDETEIVAALRERGITARRDDSAILWGYSTLF